MDIEYFNKRVLHMKGEMLMSWTEKARDFLFWWSKEVRDIMYILGETEVIIKDMRYFEDLNFKKWLIDNRLEDEYEDFLEECNE